MLMDTGRSPHQENLFQLSTLPLETPTTRFKFMELESDSMGQNSPRGGCWSRWSKLPCLFPAPVSLLLLESDRKCCCCCHGLRKRVKFERDKERGVVAHRRAVLRKESQVAEHSRRLHAIETRINQDSSKMRKIVAKVSNLHRVKCIKLMQT
ncbi:hypothetical protein HN51_030077 [Arachis hypogaea]